MKNLVTAEEAREMSQGGSKYQEQKVMEMVIDIITEGINTGAESITIYSGGLGNNFNVLYMEILKKNQTFFTDKGYRLDFKQGYQNMYPFVEISWSK